MERTRSRAAGLSRHLRSGWRFSVPRPEQGESMSRESAMFSKSAGVVSLIAFGEISVARACLARVWREASFF